MDVRQTIVSGKRNYIFALLILLCISLICVAFAMTGSNNYDKARREVLLRRVGHEVLLQSADSTSRVMPVKQIAENEYQIRFEKELSFQSDSLVNTTRRLLASDLLAPDYIVNVINCSNSSVAFSYAISGNEKNSIVACSGRHQPTACYAINIIFKPKNMNVTRNGYLLGSLQGLAFVGFILLISSKPRQALTPARHNQTFALGSVHFDPQARQLIINNDSIDLTGTETRLLLIFAMSPNETIERTRLQKEIWEDEGVIVGRSLDMFISKLRKKLEPDPKISIAVIRAKGYKLEIKP